MTRMQSFAMPHKGLRNAMAQLSLLAGNTDYTNLAEVQRLHKLGREVFQLLHVHLADENDVLLAELARRAPAAARSATEDHVVLHDVQNGLEQVLEGLLNTVAKGKDATEMGERFYLLFSEFHASQLEHMAEEELTIQAHLWLHFTDEELLSLRTRIIKAMEPQVVLLWARFIIPALGFAERLGYMRAMRAMAPAPFFAQVLEVAHQALTLEQFASLTLALDAEPTAVAS